MHLSRHVTCFCSMPPGLERLETLAGAHSPGFRQIMSEGLLNGVEQGLEAEWRSRRQVRRTHSQVV